MSKLSDMQKELETLFNEYLAPGTPRDALERAEEVLDMVENAIIGLKYDIRKQDNE